MAEEANGISNNDCQIQSIEIVFFIKKKNQILTFNIQIYVSKQKAWRQKSSVPRTIQNASLSPPCKLEFVPHQSLESAMSVGHLDDCNTNQMILIWFIHVLQTVLVANFLFHILSLTDCP